MKFEAVRIHFLSDVFGLLSSKNFATMTTWRNDFYSLMKGQNRSGERYKDTWEARTGILNSKNVTKQTRKTISACTLCIFIHFSALKLLKQPSKKIN